ncbi:hypothetical protein LCGC14_1066490 [marine sediment metagenome]|uniref:dATP/dGTP diphosphohydrolase N-terminal domain-containing protein n=1 Tax=marine sediment metagenome TaxID=412755 RepID=A0A0F9MJF7_9ZZZZ|nr:hypothetical protein [Candidatus Aminicenantes bacterium]
MKTKSEEITFEILSERQYQKTSEGWDEDHDYFEHSEGELAEAAACYAYTQVENLPWPWDRQSDKRGKHDRRRQLVIAAALLVAEIERFDRSLKEKE